MAPSSTVVMKDTTKVNGSTKTSTTKTTTTTTTTPATTTTTNSSNSNSILHYIINTIIGIGLIIVLYYVCIEAYSIRLYAIREYGLIIHEFDPYFNYRATEYLYEHGWYKFRTWFDYMVWYPLGRPVGTTIYPGMQVTAVLMKLYLLPTFSINDICCYIPAWFGVTATLAVAWLTYECTRLSNSNDPTKESFNSLFNRIPIVREIYQYIIKPIMLFIIAQLEQFTGRNAFGLYPQQQSILVSYTSAVAAACIMSIVPAHLLRSIGGGYDNESIAMTAMVLSYASWCLSLRDHIPLYMTCIYAVLTGLAYFYMVAAWGGYVFVLNVIGVHAVVLVLLGRYTTKLHRAYSIFYIVGTALAIQVPVVGLTPLKSLEQLGPCLAFVCFQLIEICEIQKRKLNLSSIQTWKLRVQIFGTAATIGVAIVAILAPTGYFGPISSRVRGLFVKHTKTGNPLVDSVAEHQAASTQAYFSYLMELMYLAPIAWVVTIIAFFNDSSSFLFVYGLAAYYFSHRMVRLILLTAPIASVLGGIFFGRVSVWMVNSVIDLLHALFDFVVKSSDSKQSTSTVVDEPDQNKKGANKSGKSPNKKKKDVSDKSTSQQPILPHKVVSLIRIVILIVRVVISYYAILYVKPYIQKFHTTSHQLAQQISHPTIIQKATKRDTGEEVLIDDYREAYNWCRDHTEADARIMAWWDYGYQITGIGNRTTIADGNTWNHEHIALLGRILTSPEKDAHRIARHLADYVLVWTGGGGDDVAKSPHLRRIANSVYRGLCREPTCSEFGFYSDRTPTEDMEASLLYKLHSNGLVPGVEVNKNRFREVFRSKYMKVRIYKILSVAQDSKEWVENNRICDAPGSWFCRGQYPPALTKILAEKKNFKQLEDFNVKDGDDSEYQKKYFENLQMTGQASSKPKEKKRTTVPKLSPVQIEEINEQWQNNEATSGLHQLIKHDQIDQLMQALTQDPRLAHIRSEDGRGPMFWAHEYGNKKIVKLLKSYGVSETRKDANDKTPLDTSKIA